MLVSIVEARLHDFYDSSSEITLRHFLYCVDQVMFTLEIQKANRVLPLDGEEHQRIYSHALKSPQHRLRVDMCGMLGFRFPLGFS